MRPEDDYTHPVGPEPNFNESMYFHFHDPGSRFGGFLRLANRPNEGRGEMTVCLYLPDGRLGFAFARPPVTSNDAFDAAGLRFDVREPMRHLDASYTGRVSLLDDPRLMADPRAAFATSPVADCAISLAFRSAAPAFDHSFDVAGESFAPHHYEQLMSAAGTVRINDASHSLTGYGLRDHSWGPRYWQTPWFYRWIHGCTDGFGFMGAYFGRPDGPPTQGGFVWDGSALHSLDGVDISTTRNDADEQDTIIALLRTGDRRWTVRGRIGPRVPLRNRRENAAGDLLVTRIVEGLTTWSLDDGRILHGMSEYLDQIINNRPVGLSV